MHIRNPQSWQDRMTRLQKVLDRDITMVEAVSTARYYAIRNAQERLIYWRNWSCTCVMCEAQKGTTVVLDLCNKGKAAYADYVEGYPDN